MDSELKPCPKCGSRLLYRGVSYRLGTPRFWIRLQKCFHKGVTCFNCGYYKPTTKAWNRRAEDGNT
jgi:hypothetical protein